MITHDPAHDVPDFPSGCYDLQRCGLFAVVKDADSTAAPVERERCPDSKLRNCRCWMCMRREKKIK